ncbi:MAG TPA: hypothetical protein VKB38_00090 [Terracidiphilus sp.]|nr:hypothetical protein [Terracidiphilus sp.]
MKNRLFLGVAAAAALASTAWPQPAPRPAPVADSTPADDSPVVLDWTPPALAALSSQAAVRNSFMLDRSLLGAAASTLPDSESPAKQAIGHLDGVSVHLLRFGDKGVPDETTVDAIRQAYHLRGWKHIVTTTDRGGPMKDGTTDVWVVVDGVNLRGAVVLTETPKSVTLVTVKGDLSPVDLLHLRGHFGIPKFDGDDLSSIR